jgi:hypothetical protein
MRLGFLWIVLFRPAMFPQTTDSEAFAEARIAFYKYNDCGATAETLNKVSADLKREALWMYYAAQVSECNKGLGVAHLLYSNICRAREPHHEHTTIWSSWQ